MKNLNHENQDQIWDLVDLIDELNGKKLEIMDEGSRKSKIWQKIEPHVRSNACSDFKEVAIELNAVPVIEADLMTKARIKEMVMEYVENVKVGYFAFFGKKRFFAAATLLVVCFFVFVPNSGFFPNAFAEKLTYVEVEQGKIEVLRGEKVLEVADYMVLKEGDRVKVLDGSLAQVYFLDDSRMAIAPGSEILMHKLYTDEENGASTEVEVFVEYGNVWVQVINLTGDEDYFSILTDEGEFRINRAADLNVEVGEDDILVQVVKNLTSFMVPSQYGDRDGMIGEGTQLFVSEDDLVIEEILALDGDVWWDYNLVEDEEHLDSVTNYYITQSADRAQLLSKSPLQGLKKFQESVGKVVGIEPTFTASDAQDILVEAEQLIGEDELEQAEVKIGEYLSIMSDVVSEGNAGQVKAQVDKDTKALSVKIVGNEGLSVIQDALDEVDEAVSDGEGGKSVTKAKNASNKLSTVNSLLDTGCYSDALEQLDAYREDSKAVAMDISEVPQEDRTEVVSQALDNKVEDLHLLKIIASKFEGIEDVVAPEFAEQLSGTKQQTLFEINALVVSLKERAIGTISGFLLQVQADESVQIQVLSSLKQDVPMDYDLMKKINDIEEVYYDDGSLVFLVSTE